MYDSGTVRHGNVSIAGHIKAFFVLSVSDSLCTVKQRLVFLMLQVRTLICFQYFIGVLSVSRQGTKYGIRKRLGKIIGIAVGCLNFQISILRVHAERHVAWKCPRSGCPCQKIRILIRHLKPDDCRTLLHKLISLGNLLRRKRGSAARTVRHNLKSFIQ